jgi:hypothetical protein
MALHAGGDLTFQAFSGRHFVGFAGRGVGRADRAAGAAFRISTTRAVVNTIAEPMVSDLVDLGFTNDGLAPAAQVGDQAFAYRRRVIGPYRESHRRVSFGCRLISAIGRRLQVQAPQRPAHQVVLPELLAAGRQGLLQAAFGTVQTGRVFAPHPCAIAPQPHQYQAQEQQHAQQGNGGCGSGQSGQCALPPKSRDGFEQCRG